MKLAKIWDLRRRFLTASIVSIVSALLIAFSPYPWVGLLATCAIASLAGIGLWEYVQLAEAKNLHPNSRLMIIVGVVEVFAFYFSHRHAVFPQLPIVILFVAIVIFFLAHFQHTYKALAQVAIELFGVIYIAIPLCFMLGILYPDSNQDGRWWLMYLIAVTKITDVGGYFVGRLWGKKKLAPFLSPKKTVEGAVAGFLSAVLMSLAMSWMGKYWMEGFDLSLTQALWLGAAIGVLAQIGDLSESLLKRDAFVKDSNSLPGLGGILDMVDSLLFTTPIVYFYLANFST
jgi:phosphatidate cytidylyltransferase